MTGGIRAIFTGMALTFRELFVRPVTVQYPEIKPFTGTRWRGVHGLFFTENLKEELCVSCHLCARVCPAVCIEMEGHHEPDGPKKLHKFDVDLGRCIYCGYCEEVCPVDAIRLTTSNDYSSRLRSNLVLHKEDLLSVGQSAMTRGENGALGIRGDEPAGSADASRVYPEWLNRKARFESERIDLRLPLGPSQKTLQDPLKCFPDNDAMTAPPQPKPDEPPVSPSAATKK